MGWIDPCWGWLVGSGNKTTGTLEVGVAGDTRNPIWA